MNRIVTIEIDAIIGLLTYSKGADEFDSTFKVHDVLML